MEEQHLAYKNQTKILPNLIVAEGDGEPAVVAVVHLYPGARGARHVQRVRRARDHLAHRAAGVGARPR